MIPKIILDKPYVMYDVWCPKCKSFHILQKEQIDCFCKNCKTTIEVPNRINLLSTYQKMIESFLSKHNEVYVQGRRKILAVVDGTNVHLDMRDDDLRHTLLALKEQKEKQGCWEVGDIEEVYDYLGRIYCNDCGICCDCLTCNKCGKVYKPKVVNTKKGPQKRYKCPDCKSIDYKKTYIKFKKGACPHCGGKNVRKNIVRDSDTCHRCGSKNITKPKKGEFFRLAISRQKRNWIPDE